MAFPPPRIHEIGFVSSSFRFVRVVRNLRAGAAKLRRGMLIVVLIAGTLRCEYLGAELLQLFAWVSKGCWCILLP